MPNNQDQHHYSFFFFTIIKRFVVPEVLITDIHILLPINKYEGPPLQPILVVIISVLYSQPSQGELIHLLCIDAAALQRETVTWECLFGAVAALLPQNGVLKGHQLTESQRRKKREQDGKKVKKGYGQTFHCCVLPLVK